MQPPERREDFGCSGAHPTASRSRAGRRVGPEAGEEDPGLSAGPGSCRSSDFCNCWHFGSPALGSAVYLSLLAALRAKLPSALRPRAPTHRRLGAARHALCTMRRLGTCLATLAGLLLTAAGQTFSGKRDYFCLRRVARARVPGRRQLSHGRARGGQRVRGGGAAVSSAGRGAGGMAGTDHFGGRAPSTSSEAGVCILVPAPPRPGLAFGRTAALRDPGRLQEEQQKLCLKFGAAAAGRRAWALRGPFGPSSGRAGSRSLGAPAADVRIWQHLRRRRPRGALACRPPPPVPRGP